MHFCRWPSKLATFAFGFNLPGVDILYQFRRRYSGTLYMYTVGAEGKVERGSRLRARGFQLIKGKGVVWDFSFFGFNIPWNRRTLNCGAAAWYRTWEVGFFLIACLQATRVPRFYSERENVAFGLFCGLCLVTDVRVESWIVTLMLNVPCVVSLIEGFSKQWGKVPWNHSSTSGCVVFLFAPLLSSFILSFEAVCFWPTFGTFRAFLSAVC